MMLTKLVNVAIGKTARNFDTGLTTQQWTKKSESKKLGEIVFKTISSPNNSKKRQLGSSVLQKIQIMQTKARLTQKNREKPSNTIESLRSMNMATRLQTQTRIREENARIAQKIIQIDPYINTRDYIEDSIRHRQMSDNMSKITKKKLLIPSDSKRRLGPSALQTGL
jgi:hypothetical protein